jgi:hypothetical protein
VLPKFLLLVVLAAAGSLLGYEAVRRSGAGRALLGIDAGARVPALRRAAR